MAIRDRYDEFSLPFREFLRVIKIFWSIQNKVSRKRIDRRIELYLKCTLKRISPGKTPLQGEDISYVIVTKNREIGMCWTHTD